MEWHTRPLDHIVRVSTAFLSGKRQLGLSVRVADPITRQSLFELHQSDAHLGLRLLPDDWLHCVFTSPPYWKVRDYGVSGQLGQEATLEEHLGALVQTFALLRRKLHPSGVLFVNYGDIYAQNGRPLTDEEQAKNHQRSLDRGYATTVYDRQWQRAAGTARGSGLGEKQLLMLPERLAMALQADGWVLRGQIVWHKPNANSESIKDRPSRDHEMIYMFARKKRYFYDIWGDRRNYELRDGWIHGSQIRTVWRVATKPSRSGHPAVFPPELARRGILLGSSPLGCCPHCAAPVTPIYERGEPDLDAQRRCGGDSKGEYHGQARRDYRATLSQDPSETKRRILAGMRPARLVRGEPTCKCLTSLSAAAPCRVFDPFSGEGTTGLAALGAGRAYVGIELHPGHCEWQCKSLAPKAEAWAQARRSQMVHAKS